MSKGEPDVKQAEPVITEATVTQDMMGLGWTCVKTEKYKSSKEDYEKNHERELKAVLRNLVRLAKLSEDLDRPPTHNAGIGFVRQYGDLTSIREHGQPKSEGRGLQATRLYAFFDIGGQVCHL